MKTHHILTCATVQNRSAEQITLQHISSIWRMIILKVVISLLFLHFTSLPWIVASWEPHNQSEKSLPKHKPVQILQPLLAHEEKIDLNQNFHIVTHLLTCNRPSRLLWMGEVKIANSTIAKGYGVLTDDDKFFILQEKPDLKNAKKLTLYYHINLSQFAFVQSTTQGQIRLISVNPYQTQQKGQVLTLQPVQEKFTKLLHLLRYATKKYYLLNNENQCEPIKLDRLLNPHQYWLITLRNSCPQISQDQLNLYLCVPKINPITYAALARSLAMFFNTHLLQLSCFGYPQNRVSVNVPINWQYPSNKILNITLGPLTMPDPFPSKKIGKKKKEQNLCQYLVNQNLFKKNIALACPIYRKVKESYMISMQIKKHLQECNHFSNPPCRYGRKCYSFKRIEEGSMQNEYQNEYDQCHLLMYHHPPRGRKDKEIKIKKEDHVFSYEQNFAKVHHLDLRTRNPLDKIVSINGDSTLLRCLLLEVVKNGYAKDLILDKKVKYDKNAWQTLRNKLNAIQLITVNEVPLLKIVKEKLEHKTHILLGKPLSMSAMCALILYTGCSCNLDLCKSQREGNFIKWQFLDRCLMMAILGLHRAESKTQQMLYSGIGNVVFNQKRKYGFLRTYVSSSWNRKVAMMFKGDDQVSGMLMHITPAMQAVFPHCDLSWISQFPDECEMLFARSADIGLMAAPQWKGEIINYEIKTQTQIVSFTPAAQGLIVRARETKVLSPDQVHFFSFIKLEPYAVLTTQPYDPQTQQGGRLLIHCYGACILEKGARIHVNKRGYPGRPQQSGLGPGGGLAGNHCAGGGSYRTAGKAGQCIGTQGSQQIAQAGKTYGKATLQKHDKLPLGSGGGAIIYKDQVRERGASGGGALSIAIDGMLQLYQKSGFQANGQDADWSTGGAGSGGTLRLTCKGVIQMPDGPTDLCSVLGGRSLSKDVLARGSGGDGYSYLDYQHIKAPQIPPPHWLHCLWSYWMRQLNIKDKEHTLIFSWILLFTGDQKTLAASLLNKKDHDALHRLQIIPHYSAVYANYLYQKGRAYHQKQDDTEAIAYYNQAIKVLIQQKEENLSNSQSTGIKVEKIYIALAKSYEATGQYAEAMQAYQKGGQKKQSIEEALAQLQRAQAKEIEMDYITKQGLSLYIPLQAADRPMDDLNDQVKTYPFIDYITAFTGQPLSAQSDQDKDDTKDDEKKDDRDHQMPPVGSKGRLPSDLQERLAKNQVLLLQGASGAGKSLSARYITTQYRYRQKSHHHSKAQWIALFISLPSTYQGTGLIYQTLIQKGLNFPTIYALQQSQSVRFLFILDGFDEIITAYRGHTDLPDKVHERFGFKDWKYSKFMISCRSQGVSDSDKSQYMGAYPEIYLIPFAQKQVKQYIVAFAQNKALNIAGWKDSQYHEALCQYPGLMDMTCEPFSLRLILQVLPHLTFQKGTQISRVQLYETFTDQWFQRQITKLKINEPISISTTRLKQTFQTYCEELALAMFKSGQQVADAGQENNIWRTFFTQEKRLSLQSSPLRKVGPKRYMFIHKSYQEYFVASRFIYNLLNLLQDQSKWASYNFADVDWNQRVYQSYFNNDPAVVSFMVDHLHGTVELHNQFKELLLDLIEYSKKNKQVSVLAANSATLLCAASVPLADKKWQGIHIPYARLDHAFMPRTDLSYSDCTGVSLRQAYIERTKWEGTQVHNINFGEYPYLQHDDKLYAVAYSPNGRYIATGASCKVCIWDLTNRKRIYTLKGHTAHVNSVAWSHDSSRLASASEDKTVHIWNPTTGQEIFTLNGHTAEVCSVAWSHDSSRLASASKDKNVRIWNPTAGQEIATLKGHTKSVTSVAWSPDSSRLASASEDKTVRIWDATTEKEISTFRGHISSVTSVAWSHDSNRLASTDWDCRVRIWNPTTEKEIYTLNGHKNHVTSVAWSPDSSRLASVSWDQTVRIWNATTGREIAILNGHTCIVRSVAWSPDSSRLASASDDYTVRIWNPTPGQEIHTLKGHSSWITSVAWSHDSIRLASASEDKTVRIRNITSGRLISILKGHTSTVTSIAWSHDSSRLASTSWEIVRIWNPTTGQKIFTLKGHTDYVKSVAWSHDSNRLASASEDYTVRIWNPTTGKEISTLNGHTKSVISVAWSHDSSRLASASKDHTVCIWNPTTGKKISTLRGHKEDVSSVAWSHDSSRLASASKDHTVCIWNPTAEQIIATLNGHSSCVTSVAWSPNSSRLASVGNDKTVRIWNPTTGQEIATLNGHTNEINSVAWSPDGSYLASASKDQTMRIWNPKNGAMVRIIGMGYIPLSLRSASFSGAIGLSDLNKRLIQQRRGSLKDDQCILM